MVGEDEEGRRRGGGIRRRRRRGRGRGGLGGGRGGRGRGGRGRGRGCGGRGRGRGKGRGQWRTEGAVGASRPDPWRHFRKGGRKQRHEKEICLVNLLIIIFANNIL